MMVWPYLTVGSLPLTPSLPSPSPSPNASMCFSRPTETDRSTDRSRPTETDRPKPTDRPTETDRPKPTDRANAKTLNKARLAKRGTAYIELIGQNWLSSKTIPYILKGGIKKGHPPESINGDGTSRWYIHQICFFGRETCKHALWEFWLKWRILLSSVRPSRRWPTHQLWTGHGVGRSREVGSKYKQILAKPRKS